MTPSKPRKLTPRQEASSAQTPPERLTQLAQDPKLARLVAANPSASAQLLLELSRSEEKAVRKACTSNANTPVEALLKLGAQFPEQLLENPVFDLLLLGHPDLFEELPTSTLNSLLKRDQVPVELIRWAWKHRGESTLHSLLINPNTPADVVEELCKSTDPEVPMAAELHCTRELPGWANEFDNSRALLAYPNLRRFYSLCPPPQWLKDSICDLASFLDLETIGQLAEISPVFARRGLAIHSHRANVLERLSYDPDKEVRTSVAFNCCTSANTLARLARDKEKEVRLEVARNSRTPVKALIALAKDESHHIRSSVAKHVHASADILTTLSEDRWKKVRFWAAANRAIPPKCLFSLAQDNDPQVSGIASLGYEADGAFQFLDDKKCESLRLQLARNSATRDDILNTLSRDPDRSVRWHIADNPNTPASAHATLAKDEDRSVRANCAATASSPEVIRYLADDPDMHESLGMNSDIPVDLLLVLANSSSSHVRRSVALNPLTPKDTLAALAGDPSLEVRSHVAANPNTPPAILELLANKTEDYSLELALAGNHCTPSKILMRLAQRDGYARYIVLEENKKASKKLKENLRNAGLTEICKEGCKGTGPSASRRFLFYLPQCPVDILAKNFRSRCWLERFAIAGNPSTPEAVLERMANEGNQLVRLAAASNLARRASAAEPQLVQEQSSA